jgi:hypothetical protein
MAISTNKNLIVIGFLIIISIGIYFIVTAPDRRSGTQKVSDAIEQLPNGIDKSARELQDKTIADRISDKATDVKNEVKETTR